MNQPDESNQIDSSTDDKYIIKNKLCRSSLLLYLILEISYPHRLLLSINKKEENCDLDRKWIK